jgi:(heptosyl)LPS beta-1,4-glucosyltransferase
VAHPHDRLHIEGAVGRLPGFLEHAPYRDLAEHMRTIDRYTARFVEVSLEKGRRARLVDVWLRPPLHFLRAFLLQAGFRDGPVGLMLAWLGATHVALKWGRLWLAQGER